MVCCYWCSVVCVYVFVCQLVTTVTPIKMAKLVGDISDMDWVAWRNHIVGGCSDLSRGRGNFGGHLPAHYKVYGISDMWLMFSTLFSRWRQQCGLLLSVLRGSGSSSSRNVSKFESFSSSVSIQSDELVRTLSTVFVLYLLTDASGQREMCDAGWPLFWKTWNCQEFQLPSRKYEGILENVVNVLGEILLGENSYC